MNQFKRRVGLGFDTIADLDFEFAARLFFGVVLSPILLCLAVVCWLVGYVVEYRQNRRDGVQTVR